MDFINLIKNKYNNSKRELQLKHESETMKYILNKKGDLSQNEITYFNFYDKLFDYEVLLLVACVPLIYYGFKTYRIYKSDMKDKSRLLKKPLYISFGLFIVCFNFLTVNYYKRYLHILPEEIIIQNQIKNEIYFD